MKIYLHYCEDKKSRGNESIFWKRCTYLGRKVNFKNWPIKEKNSEEKKNISTNLTLRANKILLHRLASSKGPNPLLPTFKHVYMGTLTCSLGCTFCTWHFTSSSSVKRKLKTVPEGKDLKQSFFFNSSCFLFTHNTIDEIPLMVVDWWC